MGTDIHGWVEFWNPIPEWWSSAIRINSLLGDRNYEVFSWLFGVCRRPDIPMRWDFPPRAAERGIPQDASHEAAAEYADTTKRFPQEVFGASWITWREIQAIDWDEPIEERVIESRVGEVGGTEYWRTLFLRKHADIVPAHIAELRPGQEWAVGNRTYKVVSMRRRDVLEPNWIVLFRLMEALADRYGDASDIRLVAWFDS